MNTSSMLIGLVVAAGSVGAVLNPDLLVSAEQSSLEKVDQYDKAKQAEYDQICQLMGCKKEGGHYAM